jgi:hypothetical protein
VAVETREVFPGSNEIPVMPHLDDRVHQRAETVRQREKRVRKRWRAERAMLSAIGPDEAAALVRRALRER